MNCLTDDILMQYLDNELPAKLTKNAKAHLLGCENCRARLDRLTEQVARVAGMMDQLNPPVVDVPAFVPPQQNAQPAVSYRPAWSQLVSPFGLPLWWRRTAVAAVVAVALAILGLSLNQSRETEMQTSLVSPEPRHLLNTDANSLWRDRQLIITVTNESDGTCQRIVSSRHERNVIRESCVLN